MATDDDRGWQERFQASTESDREVYHALGEGGMSPEQIGNSAYNAFRHALGGKGKGGQALPLWHMLPEDVQAAWLALAAEVIQIIVAAEDLPWAAIARQTYEAWARSIGRGRIALDWDGVPFEQRLGWEAAARHIANCVSFDDAKSEDVEGHEMAWAAWARRKLAGDQGPKS